MKAARLHSYDDDRLQIDDVPEPTISGPHDVIVRVGGAGLCRTDLHIIEGILAETFPELAPKMPMRRKIWQSEDERIATFDALALAVTYTMK